MARNSPGGSGVTRGFPAALSGGGGAGDLKWQEAYSVDWSAEDAHDFTSDDTLEVGGVEWKAYNNSSADVATNGLRTDGSNGLCIWPDTDKKIWADDVSSPIISVKLAEAVGVKTTYAMNKHAVCFQCVYTAAQDVDNQWDAIGAIMWNSLVGTSSGAKYITPRIIGAGSGGNDKYCSVVFQVSDLGAPEDFRPTTDRALGVRNFIQIIVWPGPNYIGGLTASLAAMPGDGKFPDPNDFAPTLLASGAFSTKSDGSAFTLANLRFGMTASAEGASGQDPNPIFTKCRVMYMEVV
jgi:hypothetical protein